MTSQLVPTKPPERAICSRPCLFYICRCLVGGGAVSGRGNRGPQTETKEKEGLGHLKRLRLAQPLRLLRRGNAGIQKVGILESRLNRALVTFLVPPTSRGNQL